MAAERSLKNIPDVPGVKVRVHTKTKRQQLLGLHPLEHRWLPLYVMSTRAYSFQHLRTDGHLLKQHFFKFRCDSSTYSFGPLDQEERQQWNANVLLWGTKAWQEAKAEPAASAIVVKSETSKLYGCVSRNCVAKGMRGACGC